MEKKVRVNTLKVTFKRGSKEPTDAEMFQFCREQHFKPEEIYSVHKDKELGAIMIKLKNENLMRAAIQALQPSLLPGFLNRPLSETDSCQMTPLGKPVGGKQSPPDKPEVPVEPMEAAMEQSEGLTSPPSALQVQLVESPVFRPNLEPEGTADQGKQPDQEGKWQLQGRKGRSKKRPESFSPGADTSKKLLRSQSLRSRSRSQRRHPKGVPETSEPQGALSTPDGQSDDQIFKKPLLPPSPSPEQQNSLLNKDDISCRYVVDFYQLKDREIYTRNRSTWWNTVVKPKTQFFFKNESRIFNCRINSAKSELYAKMYDLAAERRNGADNRNQLQEVKSELMRMELDRLKFYGSRFPQTSMLEGEKLSVFHVSNQMHKGCDGSQFQLRDGDDLITDSKRLKKKIEDFFTGTFQAEDSASLESSAEALRDVSNSLDLQQQQELVRPIDEAELKAVVAGAAKKKSPGPDGISYEFYSVYFEMLKNDMLELFNRYLDGSLKPPK
ncbi:hypothetical protein pipiens_017466 [Culex pipiens pipiens]|uniref:Uncharacterized protein n=1 Tax=Culex pipiens pipiens TaxID=38569 RepID=A0ABD1CGE4_CULPP